MRTVLIVMADLLILLAALLAVNEYRGLRRYTSFVVPHTDRLIACGAVDPARREAILRADRLGHIIGAALCVILWVMLSAFFAGMSGVIAFPVGAVAALLLVREEPGDTRENRDRYYSAHKEDIDPVRYREYLASVGDA